jgi:hypothetical protein
MEYADFLARINQIKQMGFDYVTEIDRIKLFRKRK